MFVFVYHFLPDGVTHRSNGNKRDRKSSHTSDTKDGYADTIMTWRPMFNVRMLIWMSLSEHELNMLHSLTFRSSARKPRTMVTTVGTSMQENIQRFRFCEEVTYLVEDVNATEALRVACQSWLASSNFSTRAFGTTSFANDNIYFM